MPKTNKNPYTPGQYISDKGVTVSLCLNCTKPICTGDCEDRRMMAAGIQPTKPSYAYVSVEDIDREKLTEKEREFLALYEQGLDDKACADILGKAPGSVWYIRDKLRLPPLGVRGKRSKKREVPA